MNDLTSFDCSEDKDLYQKIFKTVTTNPAKVFESKIGEIKAGNLADLVFVNQSLDTLPLRDILTHILFSNQSQHVDHVMVDGRFVLFNKELCLADEAELKKKFQASSDKIRID